MAIDPSRRYRYRRAGKDEVATVPFDALTGLKAFVVANVPDIGAPKEIYFPICSATAEAAMGVDVPLWHDHVRAKIQYACVRVNGRLTPVACITVPDRDDPRVARVWSARPLSASISRLLSKR